MTATSKTRPIAALLCLAFCAVPVIAYAPQKPANAQAPEVPAKIPPDAPAVASEPTRLPEPLHTLLPPSVSISDATVHETNGTATLTLTLDRQDPRPMKVNYSTRDHTATSPWDYQQSSGQVVFAPLSTQQSLSVQINNDQEAEPEEVLFVDLLPTSEAAVADGQGAVYIKDNDGSQEGVSISDLEMPEGNSGRSDAVFSLSLTSPVDRPVTVNYTTVDGTALAGHDYQKASGTVSFAPGQTTRSLKVPIEGDETVEIDEDFRVELSDPQNARLVDPLAAARLLNDDTQVISINSVSVKEGDPRPAQTAVFTVSLQKQHDDTQSVRVSTAAGGATDRTDEGFYQDFKPVNKVIAFPPGSMEQQFPVKVVRDRHLEQDENFLAKLSSPSGDAAINPSTPNGSATILNDDYTISAGSAAVPEGDSGQTLAVLTVSLSDADELPVSLRYKTIDGDAKSTEDYRFDSGELTFSPWETTKQLAVHVNGDTAAEGDETFSVQLSQAKNALLDGSAGRVTIQEDDGYADGPPGPLGGIALPTGGPQVSQKGRVFVTGISLDQDATPLVDHNHYWVGAQRLLRASIRYATHGRPAPRLLFVVNESLVFPLERMGMEQSGFVQCPLPGVAVPVPAVACWDAASVPWIREADPVPDPVDPRQLDLNTVDFTSYDAVVVASTGGADQKEWDALMRRSAGLCGYVNGGGGLVAFGESNYMGLQHNEPLVLRTPGPIYGFLPNLAVEPYLDLRWAEQGLRSTPAGRSIGMHDDDYAPGWPFQNGISAYFPGTAGWNAFTLDSSGRAVSVGTEGLDCGLPESPGVSVGQARDYEGDEGTSIMKVPVMLRARSPRISTVDYVITENTADAGKDFMFPLDGAVMGKGKVVFQPGEVTKTIDVPIVGDVEIEPNETFNVTLLNPVNVTINNAEATGTILNDDFPPGEDLLPGPGSGTLTRTAENPGAATGASPSATANSVSSPLSQPVQAQQAVSQGQAQQAAAPQAQNQLHFQSQSQAGLQHQPASQLASQSLAAMTLQKDRAPQVQEASLGRDDAQGQYAASSRSAVPPVASVAILVFATLSGSSLLANQSTVSSRRLGVGRIAAGRPGRPRRQLQRRRTNR